MHISDIKFLFDYNYWANQLMLRTAQNVSDEQFMQATDFSWGSLRGTLIHTLDSENMWRNLLQHNHLLEVRLTQSEPFPTLESIAEYWENEEANMRSFLNSLTDEDMNTIVRYEIPEGVRERVLWHCLVHIVNHGTQHRSECAAMLTTFGHSPGNIDMTVYLNQRD